MADLLPGAPFLDVYFDMVGALTTTGASAFKGALPLDPTLHLWIGFVAWLGGFLFWLTAAAVLAPMGLGGFEVLGSRAANVVAGAAELRLIEAPERMMRTAAQLFPIYLGLTALLWFALYVSGDTAFVAFCHAMATIATSGLSPVGGPAASGAGLAGELFVFLFLFTAISRRLYLDALIWRSPNRLLSDREVQLALICLGVVPLALFLRHWFSAPADEAVGLAAALSGLWGALFTTMSFLTTHGVQSADWTAARNWSGLGDPGLILMGLALMGGGVGTTAGGIKLLRVHALYKHGVREMDRLVHPSSVGGAGRAGARAAPRGRAARLGLLHAVPGVGGGRDDRAVAGRARFRRRAGFRDRRAFHHRAGGCDRRRRTLVLCRAGAGRQGRAVRGDDRRAAGNPGADRAAQPRLLARMMHFWPSFWSFMAKAAIWMGNGAHAAPCGTTPRPR
jgi:trk system potassium uptake protein TrkH